MNNLCFEVQKNRISVLKFELVDKKSHGNLILKIISGTKRRQTDRSVFMNKVAFENSIFFLFVKTYVKCRELGKKVRKFTCCYIIWLYNCIVVWTSRLYYAFSKLALFTPCWILISYIIRCNIFRNTITITRSWKWYKEVDRRYDQSQKSECYKFSQC